MDQFRYVPINNFGCCHVRIVLLILTIGIDSQGLIDDGEAWMETITSRNRSSHTYDQQTADFLAKMISDQYLALFEKLSYRLQGLAEHAKP